MIQQINLLNPALLKRKARFSSRTMALAAGVVALCTLVAGAVVAFQVRDLEAQVAGVQSQLQNTRDAAASLQKPGAGRTPSRLLAEEVEVLERKVAFQESVLDLLRRGEVGSTQGFAEDLRALSRQKADGLWVTEFSIDHVAKEVTLGGRSTNPDAIPAYIRALQREATMHGKTFGALTITRPALEVSPELGVAQTPPYVEFRLATQAASAAAGPVAGGQP